MKKKYHHGDLKNALINAGIEILSKEGISALSLRKVAAKAGVSHAAPYAHFKDKQDLIASISAEGFNRIYEKIMQRTQKISEDKPDLMLKEAALAYLDFALTDSDHFRITFSGIVEQEKENYPEYIEASKRCYSFVESIVEKCQKKKILKDDSLQKTTIALWSLVHGFISLFIDKQFSHLIFEKESPEDFLVKILNKFVFENFR